MISNPRNAAGRRAGRWRTSAGAGLRVSLRAFLPILLFAVFYATVPALALTAIDSNPDLDRVDITGLGEPHQGRSDSLQIETAPGSDGLTGRMSVRASTSGTAPNWFVFALRNTTGKPLDRWLVADRYSAVGSGIVWPELDARRIESVTPSIGFVPERIQIDGADVFRLTVEPGQTVTFVAEISSDRLPRLLLWRGLDFEKKSRNRQLFQGVLLGITGLLAMFLTVVFAANHKAIFPSAAVFTWAVLAYLCVDFGFWHKLFNVRPEDNGVYRAAGEAAMAATLLIFAHTFLRLGFWHGFIRTLIGIWMAAGLVLIGVAFIDPKLAATFARLSAAAIVVVFGMIMLFLALRGQDRALSLVPTWILLLVWLFATALIFTGRLSGEFAVSALTGGLVLIVTLLGFTVTQFAFRSSEPMYGAQPDEQQLRSLAIEQTGAAVWEWNARRDDIKVGAALEAAVGLKAGELNGKMSAFAARMHPADAERMHQMMGGLRDRGSGDVRLEFRLRHVDNSFRWFDLEAAAITLGDRRAVRCVGLVREITDEKRAKERLLHDAVHDNVTGLPNRALFLDRLAVAMTRARSEPTIKPTVFFVDLDRFKSINSSFGLVAGDSLLLTVARRLARHIAPGDTLARIGGDQFAMIFLHEHDPRELAVLAENMRRSLRAPINIAGQEIVLTATIGVSVYSGAAEQDTTSLLSDAEIAMYKAKRQGPDQIEIFKPAMRGEKDDRVTIESDLRQAIEKGQLKILYQPIMYLRTEELAGFEALVRWEHPRLGLLNPADFVPLAEESDLIVRLGSYVLQGAVADAQRWQKELPRPDAPLFVSVNISSRQLFRQDLINEVRHIMSRAMLPKGSLRLEITELLVMDNPEQATQMLELLASAGVGLSLDDFGTGYSSLCYLNTFPFDTLKVDRALVHTSSKTGSSSAILRSIVALAHELGKKVVAEGVESEDDVGLLRTIGCEYAQGFFYGQPVSQREVLQDLKSLRKADKMRKSSGLLRMRNRRIDDSADDGDVARKPIAVPAFRKARVSSAPMPQPAMPHVRVRPQPAAVAKKQPPARPDTRSARVAEASARLQAMFHANQASPPASGPAPINGPAPNNGHAPSSQPTVGQATAAILSQLRGIEDQAPPPPYGGANDSYFANGHPPPLPNNGHGPEPVAGWNGLDALAAGLGSPLVEGHGEPPPQPPGAGWTDANRTAPPDRELPPRVAAAFQPLPMPPAPAMNAAQLASLPPAIAQSLAMLAGMAPGAHTPAMPAVDFEQCRPTSVARQNRLTETDQAWPATLTRCEGSTPIFDSARSYFWSGSQSKINSASAAQLSHPLARTSFSTCPAVHPAYPSASSDCPGPVPLAMAFRMSVVCVRQTPSPNVTVASSAT